MFTITAALFMRYLHTRCSRDKNTRFDKPKDPTDK